MLIQFIKRESEPFRFSPPKGYTLRVLKALARQVKVVVEEKKAISVGLPIALKVKLSGLYSENVNVKFTHNCSSEYAFSPSSSVAIPAGSLSADLNVSYSGASAPPLCALSFADPSASITVLKSPIYVFSSDFTPTRSATNSLVLTFNSEHTEVSTATRTVLDRKASSGVQQLTAVIEHVQVTASAADGATVSVQANFEGEVYWAVLPGNANVTSQQIFEANSSSFVATGRK